MSARPLIVTAGHRLMLALSLTAGALAQDANQPATAPAPYWVRITGQDVNLRARADLNSMIVARLDRGEVLRVVGGEHGWLEVEPPLRPTPAEQLFSLAHGDFIETLGPDERAGCQRGVVRISSGNLRVRVGSLAIERDPLLNAVQTLLPPNAEVCILGRVGDWLKITPPADVRFYVSADYAERLPDDEAARRLARLRRSGGATTQPTTQPTEKPTPAERMLAELSRVEQAVSQQRERPIGEQQWTALVARLTRLAEQDASAYVAERAAQRLEQVEHWQAAQQAIVAAEQTLAADHDPNVAETASSEPVASDASGTAANLTWRGELRVSFYIRTRKPPQFYKLVNPRTGDLVAYVQFPPGQLGIEDWVGERVAVRGRRRADRALGADVITVASIEPAAASPSGARQAD